MKNKYLKLILLFFLVCIFPLEPIYAKESLQAVIAEGFGSDVQGARLNAAQNALIQVVGSFIDAETIINKKSEIQNGVRTQMRFLKSDIREYSQGSIANLEILESQNNSGVWRVKAKVIVRTGEFAAYIAKLADVKSSIDEGLYAEVKTDLNQGEALSGFLIKRIQSVMNGEVQEFEIYKSIPYKRSQVYQNRADKKSNEYAYRTKYELDKYLEDKGDPNTLVVVPIITKLQQQFVDNLTKTLKEIKSDSIHWRCDKYCTNDGHVGWESAEDNLALAFGKIRRAPGALIDENETLGFEGESYKFDVGQRVLSGLHQSVSRLQVRFKTGNGELVPPRAIWLLGDWRLITGSSLDDPIIFRERKFDVVVDFEPEDLSRVQSIEVAVVNKK